MQLIKDYIGVELAMHVATNYDQKIIMSLLFIVYHALTPNSTIVTYVAFTMVRLGVFGSLVSIQ
jgi:hypothetical protein